MKDQNKYSTARFGLATCFFTSLILILGACSSEPEKLAIAVEKQCRPILDGIADPCWDDLEEYPINGSLVGNVNWDGENDLSASFKVMQNDKDLIFLVKILDDIDGKIERQTLDHYWENDNIEFFFTNSEKLPQGGFTAQDSIFCFNYNSPSNSLLKVVNVPGGNGDVKFGRKNFDGGYMLEILFENQLNVWDVTKDRIPFNIEVTDNDNENLEDGFIKGRESGLAWSLNSARSSWQETINYGELIIN